MSGLREIARPMLASIFVIQGLETFQHPEKLATRAEPVVRPLVDRIPAVSAETEDAVRLNGAVQAVAGTALGLGILPRLSALVVAGTLVPTTLAGHPFWTIDDPAERAQQRIHFLKNLTIMGGLLIAAADTGGPPSLSWRRRQAARRANSVMAGIAQALTDTAGTVGGHVSSATQTAADSVSESAARAASRIPELGQAAAEQARAAGVQLAHAAQKATEEGRSRVSQLTG